LGTTTGKELRQLLSENIGDYRSLTTTSSGNVNKLTLVDTELANLTESDGGIQGYVAITSGTDDGAIRRILNGIPGYTASGTIATVNLVFSALIASGVTYELHRFDPLIKRRAINRAIEQLYPILHLPLIDESLVVDNLLSNSGFETAASGNVHPSWTKVGTPTITDETSIRRHLTNSAKIVASGAAEGQTQTVQVNIEELIGKIVASGAAEGQTQAVQVNIEELIGKTVHAAFWVYTTARPWARIRVDTDGGTTFLSSDYHTGTDQWELLKIAATIPSGATQLALRLEVADTGTGYFDAGWMAVGPLYRYTLPTTMVTGPYRVYEQYSESNPQGPYYPIKGALTKGHILRLIGKNYLSRPATDSATTEVDGARLNLIAAKAAEIFFTMVRGDRDDFRHDPGFWRAETDTMLKQAGIRMPPMSAEMPNDAWHVERDSAGDYLVFTGARE
jgi:hypothetical protein